MANYKGILIGLGVAAALVGGLFGTGVVKLTKDSDDAESSEPSEDDDDANASNGKGKRRRGRKGRRKRRRGKKSDLESLAYLGEVPLEEGTRDLVGVQRNDAGSYEGFMLANAAGGIRGNATTIREAVLYDTSGKEVHRWKSDIPSKKRGWAMARLDNAGHLYAVVTDAALIKLDWESNIIWLAEGRFHHDLTVADDGSVAVLSERRIIVDGPKGSSERVRLLDHGVVFFDPEGTVMKQVWMHDIFKDNEAYEAAVLRAVRKRGERVVAEGASDEQGGTIDAFHANSVIILPRDVEGLGKTGDILISLRNMNTVASIDRETQQARWVWGPKDIYKQHDASLTPDGNVVLFDNRTRAENSRAVVVDPKTSTVVRTVGGPDASGPLKFFSKGRGLAQGLPNGNVMVIVSNEGRAFEVGPNDNVLWEFWSPWKDAQTRKPIRGTRLEGPIQTGVAAIVSGATPAPKAPEGGMRQFTVELGGDPALEREADARDDDEEADGAAPSDPEPGEDDAEPTEEANPAQAGEPAEGAKPTAAKPSGESEPGEGDAQPSDDKPTGQDTPVPPKPQ